jgi:hypothetical protein
MTTKVGELRYKLYDAAVYNIETIAEEWGYGKKRHDDEIRQVAVDLYALIAAAREEGAEQERGRIRSSSPLIDWGSDNYGEPFYIVDVDLLAPKEVIHTKILYPPAPVLAPKEAFHATQEEIEEAIASEQKKYAALDAKMALDRARGEAMTSLENIVLPLAESRALVEKGIVLETAISWEKGGPIFTGWAHSDIYVAPAPVLSELLDAIRAKCASVEFQAVCDKDVSWKAICFRGGELKAYYANRVSTDLLAAAALLMEVSK